MNEKQPRVGRPESPPMSKTKSVTVRLPVWLWHELRAVAEKEKLSQATCIGQALIEKYDLLAPKTEGKNESEKQ